MTFPAECDVHLLVFFCRFLAISRWSFYCFLLTYIQLLSLIFLVDLFVFGYPIYSLMLMLCLTLPFLGYKLPAMYVVFVYSSSVLILMLLGFPVPFLICQNNTKGFYINRHYYYYCVSTIKPSSVSILTLLALCVAFVRPRCVKSQQGTSYHIS